MNISRMFHRFRHRETNNNADQLITAAIVSVLQDHRMSGEVLLQLPREEKSQLPAVMGLEWHNDRLVLAFNPSRLVHLRSDELKELLEHEALHIIWEHPLRYANPPHPGLVQIATDVAVNQFLSEPPQGTMTLGQLQRLLRRRIMPKQDSQNYLTLLENLPVEQQEKLRQEGIKLKAGQQGHAIGEIRPALDSHAGWKNTNSNAHQLNNQTIRLANIKKILQQAYQHTPQRDRGLLPGGIKEKLDAITVTKTVKWQQILRQQFGMIVRGQQPSHARFNRRQPLRMDLPGTVARLTPAVDIFIDNSGSVRDEELGQTLVIIQKMLKQSHLAATVYSFDAKVTSKEYIRPGKKIELIRHGGGGTSFQCVFDYLQQHQVARQGHIVIIITDGWGEKKVDTYHYRNVYWLMMTKVGQLSVENPPGRVLEMKG
ncbi:peptidase [Limosilactobacillus sp. STM2_1]|uniref:Peptidase n=1 Tax=Limosilactobacillus rudii TaxID=2759755 RepID=A0A7W3UKR2_9LACO|nr:VWA-like domain-containing protein [Limosilactobacillus rudii]MBB1079341.1 peptidase [Limosilactobacillus rudii]MBB1097387.1 peptidase [Limosilactobacillus rudii]MCD7134496.1 VWA-like domain-containing protein [Limosilactobacillus rudii]